MNLYQDFKELFIRDMDRLKKEVESYGDEESLWVKTGEIKNSGGNLALHLCGNLRHFIGSTLSNSGYVRDREFEFNGRVSRNDLLKEIDNTVDEVSSFFEHTSEDVFEREYPIEVFGKKMSTFFFIVHLQGHLNYHLGQINYHRRLQSF